MKKLIIALLLVASISTFAQDNQERKGKAGNEQKSPEERNEARMKKMTTDLNLNESQQSQMKQLYADQMAAMKGKSKDSQSSMSKEDRQAKRTADKAAMDAKVKGILTADQFVKYSALEESNKSKMQGQGQRKDRDNKEQ